MRGEENEQGSDHFLRMEEHRMTMLECLWAAVLGVSSGCFLYLVGPWWMSFVYGGLIGFSIHAIKTAARARDVFKEQRLTGRRW